MTPAAAIDVGSNAMRLIIADIESQPWPEAILSLREPVRLGTDVFQSGSISENNIQRTIAALQGFSAAISANGVRHVRAVGTSALREADNGPEVCERIFQATGLRIQVIDGAEEARLSYIAARQRLDFRARVAVIVDIGGGSVEATLADAHSIIWSESHALGSVRLLQTRDVRAIARDFAMTLVRRFASSMSGLEPPSVFCIGTGGSIETIGLIRNAVTGAAGDTRLPTPELMDLRDRLRGLTVQERVERYQLRPDKADVIVPALDVLAAVLASFRFPEIHVPFVGVKDGLLIELRGETL